MTSQPIARAQRGSLRRQRIIDAARALFIESGIHSTGIAAISKCSGVAVAQLYRDFPSKEDIVASIAEQNSRVIGDYDVLSEAIDNNDTPRIRRWLANLLTLPTDSDHDRIFIEIVAEASRNPRIATIYKGIQTELCKHLLRALEKLTPPGTPKDTIDSIVNLVMTLLFGLVHHRLLGGAFHEDQVTMDALEFIGQRIAEPASTRGSLAA